MSTDHDDVAADLDRRDFLRIAGAGTAAAAAAGASLGAVPDARAASAPRQPSSAVALRRLQDGNARFAQGRVEHPDLSAEARRKLVGGQAPFAIVVSCIDSRVPPELIFDQGLGDIFVARTAGQVQDQAVIGSVEYAVGVLRVPLVLILGHEGCGAVKAAVDAVKAERWPDGYLGALVEQLTPAVITARARRGEKPLDATIRTNASYGARTLVQRSTVVAAAVRARRTRVVSGVYSLSTGKVALV